MNIFLTYSRQEAVTASLWENFFKSCGIWVEKTEYEEEQDMQGGTSCLTILNSEELAGYRYAGVSGHTCLVVGEAAASCYNVISQQTENSYVKVIDALFGAAPAYAYLDKLFEIYTKNDFWKAVWLYEEFAKENVRRWDKIIVDICAGVLASLDKQFSRQIDSMHVQFLRFYCRYVQCGTECRTLSMRLLESKKLLEDFQPFLDRYSDDAMVLHLTGRICELSAVENKQAVFFYRRAAKKSGYSDFFYDIGHSFEKVYGDEERAIHFYKKAYLKNRNNYRALYKLALKAELEDKWVDAFNFYSMIEEQLRGSVKENCTHRSEASVKEIDYLYKAYKRMLYIYRQIFGCGTIENSYTIKIEEVEKDLLSGRSFGKLTVHMQREELGEEIADELRKRFKGECYQ